tara:strand:- start:2099 stop:4183 length:2085 start_codon:yes stop_codon:yes gene_type:complete
MRRLAPYLILLILITCAKEDSSTPSTPPAQIVKQYSLSVSAGDGGSVSIPGGTFSQGTQVSITATPNLGYTFNGWSNGSTTNPLTVSVNSNTTITANFILATNTYTLSVTAGDGGSVSSEGGEYNEGTQVTVIATPNDGYEFAGWSDGESNATRTIILNSDTNISASFSLISAISESDYDPLTQTVLLREYEYIPNPAGGAPTRGNSYSEVRRDVTDIEGSNYKLYNLVGLEEYIIIMLDDQNNVVYSEDGEDSFYETVHSSIPEVGSTVFSVPGIPDVTWEYFVSDNQFGPNTPSTASDKTYEYIMSFDNQIQGKDFIAFKHYYQLSNSDEFFPASKLVDVKYGDKTRMVMSNLITEIIYKNMSSFTRTMNLADNLTKDITIKYETDLYQNQDEVLSDLNPDNNGDGGLDASYLTMYGTNGASFLDQINLIGGRDYFAVATGENGLINMLVKGEHARDLWTHEMGHVWQYRWHLEQYKDISPIDGDTWEALFNSGVYVSDYGQTNAGEFFAESFMIYFNPNFNNPNANPQVTLPLTVKEQLDIYFPSMANSRGSTSSGSGSTSSGSGSTSSGSTSSTNLTELPSGTFIFNVTAQNSSDYIVSVADSNNTESGNDPILRVKEGDDLSFTVNAPGHPFYLKTIAGVGTGNLIAGVGNNGAAEGTVTWSVPIGSAGTYYYQCSLHGNMVGQIIVEP